MALFSSAFIHAVQRLFEQDVPVLATVHARAHPVTDVLKQRPGIELLTVTRADHDEMLARVTARLLGALAEEPFPCRKRASSSWLCTLLASGADDEASRAVELHHKHLIETVPHPRTLQTRQRGTQPHLRNPVPIQPGRVPLRGARQVRGKPVGHHPGPMGPGSIDQRRPLLR